MRAGLLKEKISILKPQVTVNDYGEEITDWVIDKVTLARLVDNGGSMTLVNGDVFLTHNKTFQVRDYNKIDEFNRIIWNGQTYRIVNVEPIKQMMMIEIKAELGNE